MSVLSFIDELEILELTVGPLARFHVVTPSLPGYFLSTYPQRQGWSVVDTARVYNHLMVDVLGYSKYIVQGGDWVRLHHILHASYPFLIKCIL